MRYKRGRKVFSISTSQEVDVDIDIDMDEMLDEVDIDDLIEALKQRGYYVSKEAIAYRKNDFKRELCDMVETGYHISNKQLINKLKENL